MCVKLGHVKFQPSSARGHFKIGNRWMSAHCFILFLTAKMAVQMRSTINQIWHQHTSEWINDVAACCQCAMKQTDGQTDRHTDIDIRVAKTRLSSKFIIIFSSIFSNSSSQWIPSPKSGIEIRRNSPHFWTQVSPFWDFYARLMSISSNSLFLL